jgi:hypothetical protein
MPNTFDRTERWVVFQEFERQSVLRSTAIHLLLGWGLGTTVGFVSFGMTCLVLFLVHGSLDVGPTSEFSLFALSGLALATVAGWAVGWARPQGGFFFLGVAAGAIGFPLMLASRGLPLDAGETQAVGNWVLAAVFLGLGHWAAVRLAGATIEYPDSSVE